MIAIKCPHCLIGLKVDEGKIPLGLTSFKCPQCKRAIPVSLLSKNKKEQDSEPETTLIHSIKTGMGQLTVLPDEHTDEQHFSLSEGRSIVGRKSNASKATFPIQTGDRTMSREHAIIEVKKDGKGGYKHYLSDNNSKNHTLYNNNYLGDGEVVVLNDNDEIILGHTVIRFND
ncbi:MAG: FHA domain-containing protein [Parabacteroides sp.]